MSDDIASAVHAAVRGLLLADPGLAAAVGMQILDEARDNTPTPYLQFGRIEPARDDTDGCLDWTVTLGIECHTRPGSGRISAQNLCGLVSNALHRTDALTVPGWAVWEVESDTFAVARQSDGKTYLGTTLVVVSLSAV